MSFLHVIDADYMEGHRLRLRFDDGTAGEVDLTDDLEGEIFRPLKTESEFAKVRVEGGAIAWPNGADLAPEYLREKLAEQAGVDNVASRHV